ncbi:MAG: polyprenyl synthetase family protein [Alphaproteobacteria bacterium]|nr:polyprenyl synthetase family protein [Alphaproteobacteria bacterium]MCB9928379.1 polyprenyl synthetase family protein [Alphaproteobacteria bacterium]
MAGFSEELAAIAAAVDPLMAKLLPDGDGPEARLFDAMRYGALGPGKRLRPFLVVTSARLFGVPDDRSLRVAAAVELLHSYSLIHDDLPAMDDDDLRRGRPTVHKEFDEATAILAGDALLPLAFEILTDPATHPDPAVRCALVGGLAQAVGARGMVGGQMLDLSPPAAPTYGDVVRMERLKTGALFAFACECGALLGEADTAARAALYAYAMDMGLAFQIIDDLLDHEGDETAVGKRVGKDRDAGKVTAITALGPDAARAQAHLLIEQALAHIARFGENANPLRDAAVFVVERRA